MLECGKGRSFPCYKSLLEPMSKGKFHSFPLIARCFPTRENCRLPPLTLVHCTLNQMAYLNFPWKLAPWECCKTPLCCTINSLLLTCVISLFLEVKLHNFPTREAIIQEPLLIVNDRANEKYLFELGAKLYSSFCLLEYNLLQNL